jgi:NDP-sugar pyrophosphorylase family protein
MPHEIFAPSTLLDLSKSLSAPFFEKNKPVWDVLPRLEAEIFKLGQTLPSEYVEKEPGVWIHREAKVHESAVILPPAVIGPGAELRPGSYLRGAVLLGAGTVAGNSTEIKNAVLFDGAKAPHYNYIGDSILGANSHMGAGAVLSNLRLDGTNVVVTNGEKRFPTGLRKFGAILGDEAQLGCNSVCNPGTILGRGAFVYPLVNAGGVLAPRARLKGAAR